MGKMIIVASHKGGVGKTTTTLNLGFSLSRLGQRVLLIDSDPQGGMSTASNLKRRTTKGFANLLKADATVEQVLIPTKDKRMAVLGSGVVEPEDVFLFEREARKGTFGKMIGQMSEAYDYTLVDAPAGLGTITTALMSASSSVLVPVSCNSIAVRTLPMFLKLIQRIRAKFNPNLLLEGILITMSDGGASCNEVFQEIQTHFPPSVLFETQIPYDEAYELASLKSIPVGMLTGGEESAQIYMNLAMELKMREMSGSRKEKTDEDEGLF